MSERKGSGVFTAGRTGEGGVAADPAVLDAFLYAAYAVGVVVLGVVAGLCVLAVPS